jgi:hypothetical protein
MAINRKLLSNTALTTQVLLIFGIGQALAADPSAYPLDDGSLPAVSALNGKLSIAGGGTKPGFDIPFAPPFIDDDFEAGLKASGSVSVPLGHRFGFQADGTLGVVQEEVYGHAGGHLFWRDPSFALLGLYGSWTIWDEVDAFRLGVEGEYYLDRVTLSGVAGAEMGDVDDGLFTIVDVNYYATDGLMLGIGHRYTEESGHALALGVEYQTGWFGRSGVSLFADGRIGEDDYQSVFAGVRLYLGEDKSLIRRHREDDPPSREEDQSLISCTDGSGGALLADGIGTPKLPCNEDLRIRAR